ncbi:hypothetical protein BC936DRAFT_147024, partial [Jimgerdemannia flammicorona]
FGSTKSTVNKRTLSYPTSSTVSSSGARGRKVRDMLWNMSVVCVLQKFTKQNELVCISANWEPAHWVDVQLGLRRTHCLKQGKVS